MVVWVFGWDESFVWGVGEGGFWLLGEEVWDWIDLVGRRSKEEVCLGDYGIRWDLLYVGNEW